jgi:hypothetical protein
MKVEIVLENNWGYRTLSFYKTFDFDFTPFMGLRLTDSEGELNVSLENNDITTTMIWYEVDSKSFEVSVRKNWGKYGVSPEFVKSEVEHYKKLGWEISESEEQIQEMIDWATKNQFNR